MLPGNKRIFVVGYHQSPFGKLGAMTLSEMIHDAVLGTAADACVPTDAIDVASVAGLLTPLLQDQTLLAGLVASVPGMASKPIDCAENACASGGQAILNVIHKLLLGGGEVGLAIGVEKMRDDEGKMDGRLIGRVLGTASDPSDRPGKIFVFPHIFAEEIDAYMKHWRVGDRELAQVPVSLYGHGNLNPLAQMQKVSMSVDKVMTIEGPNRYLAEGLPLKTFESSQVSDGYAGILLATEVGLARIGLSENSMIVIELVGFGQATDPLATKGRDVLLPAGANRAMRQAYNMAGIGPDHIGMAEVHDCFGVMGAMSIEVLGLAEPGKGAQYYVDGKADIGGTGVPINTSGGLIAKGHPIGASGIAMVGWNYRQLIGKVPRELQVENARYAASFNIGGPICASVTTILKAR